MKYLLTIKDCLIFGEISLPTSKSISNRLLIIRALSKKYFEIENISQSNDTKIMQRALNSSGGIIDVEDAGTCMRFLTAYFAFQWVKKTLICNDRMKKRPIGILIEALNSIGAKIRFKENVGFPPLIVEKARNTKNYIQLKGSISSQFITALLLIAPTLPNGLTLKIKDEIVSKPYIMMTLELMKVFGIHFTHIDDTIIVKHQEYIPPAYTIKVEADWSAASYWFSMIALAKKGNIYLHGLKENSIQGDSKLVQIFDKLGVSTTFQENGIRLKKKKVEIQKLKYNFIETPDLVQTMVVCCSFLAIPFTFTGIETLKIKETDRINALINELLKFGYLLTMKKNGELSWQGKISKPKGIIEIETYNDHRMAMAFAPIVFKKEKIVIKQVEVVKKSYPNFWQHLQEVGINCKTNA